MNQSSGWVSASLGCVPLVPKSNPLVIASFYARHFLEMWKSDFFQHYVVCVILFEGLSLASLLHQLKSSECYHSSECVMDFCLLEMHKILYFLNFAKWAVSIPCQTGEGDRLVCLSYENTSVPYYGMAKAKDISDTIVHWLLLEVWTWRSPSSLRMRLCFSSPVFLVTGTSLSKILTVQIFSC